MREGWSGGRRSEGWGGDITDESEITSSDGGSAFIGDGGTQV